MSLESVLAMLLRKEALTLDEQVLVLDTLKDQFLLGYEAFDLQTLGDLTYPYLEGKVSSWPYAKLVDEVGDGLRCWGAYEPTNLEHASALPEELREIVESHNSTRPADRQRRTWGLVSPIGWVVVTFAVAVAVPSPRPDKIRAVVLRRATSQQLLEREGFGFLTTAHQYLSMLTERQTWLEEQLRIMTNIKADTETVVMWLGAFEKKLNPTASRSKPWQCQGFFFLMNPVDFGAALLF